MASYAGGSFSTGGVTYSFPTNDYAFSGTGVAPIPAGAVYLAPDPSGTNTILISCADWTLPAPNQSISMDIYFQATDADIQGGWQHSAAVTGDGSVSESTTVESTPPAVSTSFQTATNGVDPGQAAWFPDQPQNVTVHISLSSGNNGTASLRSYGTHFGLQFPTLNIAFKKPNNVQVSFVVAAGQTCTLQSAPDLLAWSDLFSLTNTNSTGVATNYLASIGSAPAQKFFRLRLP
ncbi:MAG TPA: hypothetical protein VMU04_04880 [Candidatus Acidoferrum sp.]|nr:hypothetical protein [Candidatus Acidoferrum sp.]